ncbi:MAG: hypothetical protein J0L64_25665 [Acidobacteria bacterium]|nr:hypothetical protein [Acidobacteriota bacterium]
MSFGISIVLVLMLLTAGIVIVAAIAWMLSHASKTRNAPFQLAHHLAWPALTPGRALAGTWYAGSAHSRRVAIKLVALRNERATGSPRRTPYLRIVMEVLVPQPLGVMAFRPIGATSSLQRFEDAFALENESRLGSEARQAMLGFVARGYPTGIQGATFRASPGTRNLWLKDRARIEPGPLDPAVLPDARTVLVYDHPHPELAPEAFQQLLGELALVASALERQP